MESTKVTEEVTTCSDCTKECPKGDMNLVNNESDFVCDDCFEDYRECANCCNNMRAEDMEYCDNESNYYCNDECHENNCESCYSSDDRNGFRHFDLHTTDFKSEPDTNIINRSPRIYSAEIECNYNKSGDIMKLANKIPRAVGIETDGSLGNRGIEVVTPPLSGVAGDKLMRDIGQAMKELKFNIDRQCGLHLHIDMSDIFQPKRFDRYAVNDMPEKPYHAPTQHSSSYYEKQGYSPSEVKHLMERQKESMKNHIKMVEAYAKWEGKLAEQAQQETNNPQARKAVEIMKRIMLFYIAFEGVIASFLPMSRRTNRFCYPLSKFYSEKEVNDCNSLDDFEKLWYRDDDKRHRESRKNEKYDNTRYAGVNFHSLLKDGHIEIRFHSGTTQAEKILHWSALNCAIIDFCRDSVVKNNTGSGEYNSETLQAKYMVTLEDKTKSFFDLLKGAGLTKGTCNYFKARQEKFLETSGADDAE